jgi:hypothetical protein
MGRMERIRRGRRLRCGRVEVRNLVEAGRVFLKILKFCGDPREVGPGIVMNESEREETEMRDTDCR